MKTPDKNKVYDLSKLNDEQLTEMLSWLQKIDGWDGCILSHYQKHNNKYCLYYREDFKEWSFTTGMSNLTCATELFTDQTPNVGKKVEKPQHYANGIDTFKRMESNCTKEECLAFAKGNIDKYNWREKGQDLEDFNKIISYAQWAIQLLTK